MTPSSNETPGTGAQGKPKRNTLATWLALSVVIFVILAFCGQLALLLLPNQLPSGDTRSRLQVLYQAWAYNEIPPIDVAALIQDLQEERDRLGTPGLPPIVDLLETVVLELPTTLPRLEGTPTAPPPAVTPSATPEPTSTRRPTNTPTQPPTVTPSPSPTRTWPPPPPPTSTDTEEPPPPPPPPSRTPTQTVTPSPSPVTPTPTFTHTPETPTVTVEVTEPTPTYAPVRPIAENNGESIVDPAGQGCLAYFGYRNDNPVEVDIPYDPVGGRNFFNVGYVLIDPEPPSHFLIERVSPAFMVIWNVEGSFIWNLDGRQAEAFWCDPP
jgi:hypothetical protein